MIHVKWGRDVLHIPLPPLDTPLGTLRAELAANTHLPVGSFKLVYKGAVMKEDGAMLSTYKLKEGATIALIGGDTLVSPDKSAPSIPMPTSVAASKAPQTEETTIRAIRAELESVRKTLVPDVDAFVLAFAPPVPAPVPTLGHTLALGHTPTPAPAPVAARTASTTPDPTPSESDRCKRLSELLLQSLLRLDALHVSGMDWPEARVQRKAAVREVQGVLDRLDGAWAAR